MTVARDVSRPPIDESQAAALAAKFYGVSGKAKELPSERDRNFLVGDRFVFKVANRDTDTSQLDLQERCLAHVSSRTNAVVVPQLVKTRKGASYATVELAGAEHPVRLMTFVPGRTLGSLRPRSLNHLRRVGAAAGSLIAAFDGFDHPAAPSDFTWDLRSAPARISALLPAVANGMRVRLESAVQDAQGVLDGIGAGLPISVIHGDMNDHNVIVGDPIGVIDFGDVHRSVRIAEVAIAGAYAAFGFVDPIEAIGAVAAGADELVNVSDEELAAVVPLAMLRLALSIAMAAEQVAADPGNAYLAISQDDAVATLDRLAAVPLGLATARVRATCGRAPHPASGAVATWLRDNHGELAAPLALPITEETTRVVDWSVTSPYAEHPAVAPSMDEQARVTAELMDRLGATVGLGRYGEPRLVYAAPEFAVSTNRGPQARTVHLGVDLSCPPGTAVLALYEGTIERVEIEDLEGGYGPVITMRHAPADAPAFFTLYGHLGAASIDGLSVGDRVETGDRIAAVGEPPSNGNWPPHLHFQIITDTLGLDGPFPGVALPEQWDVWSSLSPSPGGSLGLPPAMVDAPHPDDDDVLRRRRAVLPPSLSTSYGTPLVAVRGLGAYLYDGWGRAHVDCVNNVAHVGHEHPAVVRALSHQAALLNTNSRYPHPERVRYIERLLQRFPDHLDTAFLVCTGSEANDLALRIARTVTGRQRIVVLEGAYHGHTTDLIAASPYKYDGPGGRGRSGQVHTVPLPDPFRHPDNVGSDNVRRALETAAKGGGAAAFMAESLPGVAGQIVPPSGWLRDAFAAAHAVGALAIADEVQVGLGRVGSHWWAFEMDGAEPDIVTLGKPLGNGHPLAAVVTTKEIAAAFANGMEYFNTFGGNPVSCAVGNAVLDVIDAEDLMNRASEVGGYLRIGLEQMAERHAIIGDVRGAGMFLGVELVTDKATKEPAASQATYVVEHARELGVLLSVDGLLHNVLKFKPPLAFGIAEAERVLAVVGELLAHDGAQPQSRID